MALTKEQITEVKGRGFLLNRGTECFSGRVVSIGGVFSADALRALAECAERFGEGKVIFMHKTKLYNLVHLAKCRSIFRRYDDTARVAVYAVTKRGNKAVFVVGVVFPLVDKV